MSDAIAPPATVRRHAPAPATVAAWLAGAATIAIVLALTATPLTDYDTWQHLRVGEVIWRLHEVPRTNVWTWPTLGQPYDLPSWLFRALLWPCWAAFGPAGLQLWRWATALALVALLAVASRRAGGTRFQPVLAWAVITWAAVYWFPRWQCRPETLVAPVFAALLLVLEARRAPTASRPLRRDPVWLLVPLVWLWIQLHLSYYVGLVAIGAYALDALQRSRHDAAAATLARRLLLVAVVATVSCLVHPLGWRAAWQPFGFALTERSQPIFRVIDELQPLDWGDAIATGLAAFLAIALGLAVRRWRREGVDAAQAIVLALLLAQACTARRFVLPLMVATTPWLVRDACVAVAALRGRARALVPALACVPALALAVLAIAASPPRPGAPADGAYVPVRACDWIARHDVRGRGYNLFWHGGYLLWRFWPDSGRLPFMDIHQTGTRAERDLMIASQSDSVAWEVLQRRYAFDWLLLPTRQAPGQHLLDRVDADSSRWALVFADDAACLFLRRDGRDAALAAAAYRELRLGRVGAAMLARRAVARPAGRVSLARELDRAIAASEWSSRAASLRAAVLLGPARTPAAVVRIAPARPRAS